ncbi:MAG: hypothetical protein CL578_02230 [Alteromonadaceae bacterium]|mgnify:CR=1 FL=1|uniref:hypothetical protein n=2 Tax=Paraglaciecola TaxID=1621534 RepID=UPI000C5CBEE1|nr:hypothetical protein [Paraglaciecola agarilytica]MBN23848.1 hypothetical protein [Alteromonadaceae bacterium]|tara:strand:+ start:80117 stop:81979 length:1863 start_codon:yes stop_codon:yes gene_type:complete
MRRTVRLRQLIKPKIAISVATIMLAGCSVAPEHHVRTGSDPRFQDKNVAFRTTYYFRVFDYCKGQDGKHPNVPASDGLYRFTMTGKANTTTNNIKFESGSLKSWEIDPLGAAVIYDENIKRYRYVSENETQARAEKAQAWDEYLSLQKEYSRILKLVGEQSRIKDLVHVELIKVLEEKDIAVDAKFDSKLGDEMLESKDALDKSFKINLAGAVTQKRTALIEANKDGMNAKLNAMSREWLKTLVIQKLKENLDKAVSSASLPSNFLSAQTSQATWDGVITGTLTPTLDFTANENAYVDALSKYLVSNKDISNIAGSDGTTPFSEQFAQVFVDDAKTKNTELADVTADFAPVLNWLKDLAKGDADGTFKDLTPEHREVLKNKLSERVDTILISIGQMLTRVDNLPDSLDFDNEKNLLLLANKDNVAKALIDQSGVLIAAVVENSYLNGDNNFGGVLASIRTAMNAKLQAATGVELSSSTADIDPKAMLAQQKEPINCDMTKHKGFQVLGPEGWRTFDQDERLIMAMYVDNSPITQVLKQLSQQVLNAHQANEPQLLPVVEAELRLSKAKEALAQKKHLLEAAADSDQLASLCELTKAVEATLHDDNQISSAPVLPCQGEAL